MEQSMKRLFCVLALLVASCSGQGNYTSTTTEVAFTAATVAAVTLPFRNAGGSAHWLQYCTTGAASIGIQLEGSNDGTNWFGITTRSTTIGCAVLEAGGYFAAVRANLVSLGGGSVTAYYSSAPSPIPGGGITQLTKTPQIITFNPPVQVSFQNRSSTAFQLVSSNVVIYRVYFYNPNATPVFCALQGQASAGGMISAELWRLVPASSDAVIDMPGTGQVFNTTAQTGSVYIFCSTDRVTPTAPAVGIDGYALMKGIGTVLTKGNTGGSQTNTQGAYQ
jgi:hypothetical protein